MGISIHLESSILKKSLEKNQTLYPFGLANWVNDLNSLLISPQPLNAIFDIRRTRRAGHCWRSRDELIRDVLLWTPTHGRANDDDNVLVVVVVEVIVTS